MESFENSSKTIESKTINLNDSESLSGSEKAVETEGPELTPISEIFQQLSISRDTAYNRMHRLQIKPWKKGRRSFLDREQVGYMNDLHRHYQATGGFDGFPIPEPTGPSKKTKPPQEESKLAVRKEATIEKAYPSSMPLYIAPVKISEDVQEETEELFEEKGLTITARETEELHEEAKVKAVTKIIARETLTLMYESTERFDDGLKEIVEAHRQRCRAARRRGQEAAQDFLNQNLRSHLAAGKNGSTQ